MLRLGRLKRECGMWRLGRLKRGDRLGEGHRWSHLLLTFQLFILVNKEGSTFLDYGINGGQSSN